MYTPQDLFRDIPKLLGDDKVDGIVELDDSFTLVVKDKYGNENYCYTVIIDKNTGEAEILGKGNSKDNEEHIQLECTGTSTESRYFSDFIRVPNEFVTYGTRVTYELCDKDKSEAEGVERFMAIELMLESTNFKDIDYDTMKSIAIMYIKEYSKSVSGISRLNKLSLEQKIEEAKKYM